MLGPSHALPKSNPPLFLLRCAVQGPLDHTRERFWHCVYEQNCSAIVMVTNCVERNLRK